MNNAGTSINRDHMRDQPDPVTKRQACTSCQRRFSIGQFPVNCGICVTCKPMPAGWRRGGIV